MQDQPPQSARNSSNQRPRSWFSAVLVAGLALALWLGLSARDGRIFGAEPAPRPVAPRGELRAEERATIELFERARGSVVFISTSRQVVDFWTRNVHNIPRGTGSGFIWDEQGHIVTNFHVIQGATSALIRLADQRELPARLVGASPAHDLAVLRIEVDEKPVGALPIGSSHDLKVGQSVFAIGNPFGLDWTLTTGIISALDRSLPTSDGGLIEHLIQTDAAINPGNSGGPLLDSAGRLIGVNTAIFSPSGAYAGVGFAVPVDTVNRVVPEIIAYGRYTRPSIGVEVDEDLNQLVTRQLGVAGVVVLRVTPGSSAAAAGIRGARLDGNSRFVPGDIIVALEGKPIDSVPRLLSALDDFQAGQQVRVTLLRDGRKVDVRVTLQEGSE